MEPGIKEFDKILKFNEDYALVLENRKVCKYNYETGTTVVVIPNIVATELRPCCKGGCIVRDDNDGAAYFDENLNMVIDFIYPYLYDIHPDANALAYGKMFQLGVLTLDGKALTKPIYRDILYGDGVYTLIYQEGDEEKTLFIDESGKQLFGPIAGVAGAFKDGVCLVRNSKFDYSNAGLIDKNGNYVIPRGYTIKSPFDPDSFIVDKCKDTYFIDGLAPFSKDGKWGYFNIKGEEVIPLKYSDANRFCNGLASVNVDNGHAIYINTKGETVISGFTKGSYYGFAFGLAPAANEFGRFGYLNLDGEFAIEPQYSSVESFLPQGIAEVTLCGKSGYIDKTGKLLIPCVFSTPNIVDDVISLQNEKEKYGIYDITGKKLVTCKYYYLEILTSKYAAVKLKIKSDWSIIKYR